MKPLRCRICTAAVTNSSAARIAQTGTYTTATYLAANKIDPPYANLVYLSNRGRLWYDGRLPLTTGTIKPRKALRCLTSVPVVVQVMSKYARSIWRSLAIMTRMVAGTLVSIPLGLVHVEGLAEASWVAFVSPFRFGAPTFSLSGVTTWCRRCAPMDSAS